jgi:hypothetical protein
VSVGSDANAEGFAGSLHSPRPVIVLVLHQQGHE